MSDFKKLAVIGYPIKQSLSPLIHNGWIKEHGLSGEYTAIEVAPEQLEEHVKYLIEQEGYTGFNVTIPHKEAVLDLCSEIDETVPHIGSVNTLIVQQNGMILGKNTDAFGFAENIKQKAPDFNFAAGKAIVLGAGGAARAIIYALKSEGVNEIILCNRTAEKAENLAGFFEVDFARWEDRHDILAGANMLVNTTSLGMSGQPDLEIDLKKLPETALVNDIVYKPLQTDLLQHAQAKGCKIVTGIGMLLHQARPAFEAWFGIMPEVTKTCEDEVLSALK